MVIEAFPPVEEADSDGFLAYGGDLEAESLLLAYKSGIFPWPHSERRIAWFSPPNRALIFLEQFHPSKSLIREREHTAFTFSINHAFEQVISNCRVSKNRRGQSGTWITEKMRQAYTEFHKAGFAHSVECWHEGELVGGIYGIAIGGMFAGESMFYLKPNASKLALWYLVEQLRSQGAEWMDCQVMNPNIARFGAVEIPRREYISLLQKALKNGVNLTFPHTEPAFWK